MWLINLGTQSFVIGCYIAIHPAAQLHFLLGKMEHKTHILFAISPHTSPRIMPRNSQFLAGSPPPKYVMFLFFDTRNPHCLRGQLPTQVSKVLICHWENTKSPSASPKYIHVYPHHITILQSLLLVQSPSCPQVKQCSKSCCSIPSFPSMIISVWADNLIFVSKTSIVS